MKEEKEISIEEKTITDHSILVEYYEENDWKQIAVPLKELEDFLVENNLLDWHEVVLKNNEHTEDRDGTWEFSTFIKEKLDDEILVKFVIWYSKKMKSA